MAELNVNCINPFLEASITVMGNYNISLKVDKPTMQSASFVDTDVIILIGVTGEMKGQVILRIPEDNALTIASSMMSTMMGMPMTLTTLDDMAISAVSELGNQIMGTASTILSTKNIGIDITPPALARGNVVFEHLNTSNICVPLKGEGTSFMDVNISVKLK